MNFGRLKTELDRQNAGRGGGGFMKFADGETKRLRFIGGDDEPFLIMSHFVKRVPPKGRGLTCYAHGPWADSYPGCILCAAKGDPGIGDPNPRYLMTVLSGLAVHPFTTQQGDKQITQNFPCTQAATGRCDACAAGHAPQSEGRMQLELAGTHMQNLVSCDKSVRKRCKACRGLGELHITGHECSYCGSAVNVPLDPKGQPLYEAQLRCPACHNDVNAEPSVRCSEGCEDAEPMRLSDCWVDVTRSGGGKSTTYSFTAMPPSPLTEAEVRITPLDFANKKPGDPNEVARLCGIANPWGQQVQPGWPQQPPTGAPAWGQPAHQLPPQPPTAPPSQGGFSVPPPPPQQPAAPTVSAETVWGGAPQGHPPFQAPQQPGTMPVPVPAGFTPQTMYQPPPQQPQAAPPQPPPPGGGFRLPGQG